MDVTADEITELIIVRLCQNKIISDAINLLSHEEWENLEDDLYRLANEAFDGPRTADEIIEDVFKEIVKRQQ